MIKLREMSGRLIAICSLVVLVIAVVVFCFAPLKEVQYSERVAYQTSETYYVQESYTVQEPYIVQVPHEKTVQYTETVPSEEYVDIKYNVLDTNYYNWFWTSGCDVSIVLRNSDTEGGRFRVDFHIRLKGGATIDKTAYATIGPWQSEEVEVYYDGAGCSSFTYSVDPPQKKIVEYREVERERTETEYEEVTEYETVTKWRQVPKQRTVTKYKDVTKTKLVSALDYLSNY